MTSSSSVNGISYPKFHQNSNFEDFGEFQTLFQKSVKHSNFEKFYSPVACQYLSPRDA